MHISQNPKHYIKDTVDSTGTSFISTKISPCAALSRNDKKELNLKCKTNSLSFRPKWRNLWGMDKGAD